MQKQPNVLFALILCLSIFAVSVVSSESSITGKEAEEYDRKLSEFIEEILENFREQMREGIDAIGIPPIDPLTIPDIDEDINESIAKLVLRMRHLNITGISQFQIKLLRADLEKGFVNVSLAIPELTAEGYCYMNGKIIGIFPVSSDGPFFIRVNEVNIAGHGDLNVPSGTNSSVHMNDLKLELHFEYLDIEFKSLLGGGRWTQVLVKLLSALGPKLFQYFHEEAMTEINKALLVLINKELDKGTLKDLLDMIPSPGM